MTCLSRRQGPKGGAVRSKEVTASTDIEQAAEVQPEEGGDEAVTEESSEGTSTEVTVNDEETDGQAADPVDDNSENAVVTGGSDSKCGRHRRR